MTIYYLSLVLNLYVTFEIGITSSLTTNRSDSVKYISNSPGINVPMDAIEIKPLEDNVTVEIDLNEGDERNEKQNLRIVGGFEVENINQYPYHAGYGGNCGAAIIDKRWAITAAHCGMHYHLQFGSKHLQFDSKHLKTGYITLIARFFIHPKWSEEIKRHPFDYDFQLLQLKEDLHFTPYVQALKIAKEEDMVLGKAVTVTGWGTVRQDGPHVEILRAVKVPLVSKLECQKVDFPMFRNSLTPRMFCAGYAEGGIDACQGDSGGPAAADNKLFGLVSFGFGCGVPKSFGVYANVVKVRSWIEKTTLLRLD